MAESDARFHLGHRERLRKKFLDGKLADYEQLELLLGYAMPRRDVRPLAHALIKHFGSVDQVLSASFNELTAIAGVGRSVAILLKVVHEIILAGYRDQLTFKPIFHNATVLENYCRWSLANKNVEEFHVLYLDSEYRLLHDELHSSGTYNASSVYAREIAKNALMLNACSVVLVHNHPTTDNSFSQEDIKCTEELETMFRNLDIHLYDHILISKFSVYSARAYGFLHN